MNKKAEYGGNAMFQNNKKAAFLDYLMIIVGTALMATAINSVFDMSGMVTGGFSGIAIIIKAGSQGIIDGGIPLWVRHPTVDHKLKSEYPAVSDRNEAQWIPVCEKGTGGRNLPVILAGGSSGI